MDRSLFPDGTITDQPELGNTENTKIFHILRHRIDNWERGIHSGLILTVNPVNLNRVDLTPGTGYAPTGEFVEVLVNQLNIALAHNTLGAINFVYLFYTEVQTNPAPHETNGTIPNTRAGRSFRLLVLTSTQFAALPLTDPTFANDAQDRAL